MATRPRFTLPERLTARISRLLKGAEILRNELAKERVAHADTKDLWQRQQQDQQNEITKLIDNYRAKSEDHAKNIRLLQEDRDRMQRALNTYADAPAAHSHFAGRVVPLKYWADGELLALLHTLEEAVQLPDAKGIDALGLPTTSPRQFPFILLTHVTQECCRRALVTRVEVK